MEGEERFGDWGGAKSSWRRVSRILSSNRESSSSRKVGTSRPLHALMG